jgi:hypothetical protein
MQRHLRARCAREVPQKRQRERRGALAPLRARRRALVALLRVAVGVAGRARLRRALWRSAQQRRAQVRTRKRDQVQRLQPEERARLHQQRAREETRHEAAEAVAEQRESAQRRVRRHDSAQLRQHAGGARVHAVVGAQHAVALRREHQRAVAEARAQHARHHCGGA